MNKETVSGPNGPKHKNCEMIEPAPERQSHIEEQLFMLKNSVKRLTETNVELADRLPSVLVGPMPSEGHKESPLDELVPLAHDIRDIRILLDDNREFMLDIIERLEL